MSESRAYSDKDDKNGDKYSDDFASDEDNRTPTPVNHSKNQRSSHHQYYQDRFRGRGRGAGGGARPRGRVAKRGRGNSRNSEPIDMRKSHDTVTARVLSASRNKINELRNKVEELRIQIKDLEQENRLYKKLQFRQEKAIRVIEEKENDLPSILEKHNNEVRTLREQNRKLKEKYDKSDRYLRDAEDELERVKKKMNKYREMCEQKELQERDELTRKLTKAELDMEEKTSKIKELERHLDALKKNHRHELGIEGARQKELKKQVEELTDKNSQLENQLKEKEKALEYHNIYSRPPRSTQDNTPEDSPVHKPKKKTKSLTELTPRDKAKFYAEKKRAELQRKKEEKAEQDKKKRKQWEEVEKEKNKNGDLPPDFTFNSLERRGVEEDFFKEAEEEEKQWQERENREKKAKEDMEKKRRELEKRRLEETTSKRERDETERSEREEKERRDRLAKEEKEKRAKKEREIKEREDMERREREERDKERKEQERKEAEKAEMERRAQMEKERLENDPIFLEERRKKDELLRKLNALDENDPVHAVSPSKKTTARSNFGDGVESPTRKPDPKEYSFTKPINNLHQGKPAYEDVSVPYLERQKQKRRPSDDDLGGYQPSFGPPKVGSGSKSNAKPLTIFNDDDDEPAFKLTNTSTKTTKSDKKSTDLLENLFGPQAAASKKAPTKPTEDKDAFFLTDQSPSPVRKQGSAASNTVTTFPWDAAPSGTKGKKPANAADTEKTMTLFGGGAAIVDDDLATTGKVLPRRQRQPNLTTFSSKPSVTAVGSFDDEIEEVVL